jgi:hypothetical protein
MKVTTSEGRKPKALNSARAERRVEVGQVNGLTKAD